MLGLPLPHTWKRLCPLWNVKSAWFCFWEFQCKTNNVFFTMFKECLSYSFLVLQTKLVIYLFTYLLKRFVHHFKDRTPLKVSIYLNTAFQSFHTQVTDLGKKIVNWTFQKMLIKQRISMINYQTRPEVYFYRCNILIHPQKTSRKSRCVTPHICWRMCVPPHGASSDGVRSPYITALLLPR